MKKSNALAHTCTHARASIAKGQRKRGNCRENDDFLGDSQRMPWHIVRVPVHLSREKFSENISWWWFHSILSQALHSISKTQAILLCYFPKKNLVSQIVLCIHWNIVQVSNNWSNFIANNNNEGTICAHCLYLVFKDAAINIRVRAIIKS